MFQDIDFLPDEYRQHQKRREKTVWRRAVLAVFLLLIVLGTFRERENRVALQRRQSELQRQTGQLATQLQNADELQKKIKDLDLKANLITQLRIQPSSTRLLSVATECLPRFVMLTNYTAMYEGIQSKLTGATTSRKSKKATPKRTNQQSPEEADLERLRQEASERAFFVSVEGLAPDGIAISNYLLALDASGFFDDVTLVTNDPHSMGEWPMREFRVRLQVRKPRLDPPPVRDPSDKPVLKPDATESSSESRAIATRLHQPISNGGPLR